MTDLTPLDAARIAAGVYRLREHDIADLAALHQDLGCEDQFEVGVGSNGAVAGTRFTGRSGGLVVWKKITGFGYLAAGKGQRQGEVLVATRGTAIGVDWLSNLNIGVQIGPSGFPVHAGFNDVWQSFRDEVATFMRGRNPSVIHCVGHSLGGALATLNADSLSHARAGDVRLYTFGSPRVGTLTFANSLSGRLADGRIHRVYHRADPVPMIPVFPFFHVSTAWPACALAGGDRGPVSVAAHSMAGSYIPGVGNASWAALEHAAGTAGEPDVPSWLDQVANGGGSILPLGARVLQMIGRALAWLVKQATKVLVGVFGTTLTASMTVLDQLAWLLGKGAQATLDLGRYVTSFIDAVCRFLGRTATATVDVTAWFIRYMLDLLFTTVARMAAGAIHRLG